MARALILISDDDKLLVKVLSDRFSKAGFDVLPDTESRAYELARNLRPHLVVLDVYQPVGGMQLLAWIRGDTVTADIPVVMMTATPSDEDRQTCLDFGAAGYAKKPLDEAALMRFARLAVESFDRREMNRQLSPPTKISANSRR